MAKRDDGDFLEDLRKQIVNAQGRRVAYVHQKLTFVISFLGLGSISLGGVRTWPLLYMAPVIALVFDFYILGEGFAIKRLGIFIRESPKAPGEERLWERCVSKYRGALPRVAGLLSSGLVLLGAGIGLWGLHGQHPLYWAWIIVNFVALICAWYLDRQGRRKLRKVEEFVEGERSGQSQNKRCDERERAGLGKSANGVSKEALLTTIASEAAGLYGLLITVSMAVFGGTLLFLDRITPSPTSGSLWLLGLGWLILLVCTLTCAWVRWNNLESGRMTLEGRVEDSKRIDKPNRMLTKLAIISLGVGIGSIGIFGMANIVNKVVANEGNIEMVEKKNGSKGLEDKKDVQRLSIPYGSIESPGEQQKQEGGDAGSGENSGEGGTSKREEQSSGE